MRVPGAVVAIAGLTAGMALVSTINLSCGAVKVSDVCAAEECPAGPPGREGPAGPPGPPGPPGSSASSPPGTVVAFAGLTPPDGWLLCDGSEISRAEYAALFAVVGNLYGAGDNVTTFRVPDLRGRVIGGAGAGPQLTARELGARVGEEQHTLTAAEVAPHRHTGTTATANPIVHRVVHQVGVSSHGNHATGWTGGNHEQFEDANFASAAHTHDFATDNGNVQGRAHNVMQPTAFLHHIIKY